MFSVACVCSQVVEGSPCDHKPTPTTHMRTPPRPTPLPNMLKFVHYVVHTSIGKWAVGLQLKGLLVRLYLHWSSMSAIRSRYFDLSCHQSLGSRAQCKYTLKPCSYVTSVSASTSKSPSNFNMASMVKMDSEPILHVWCKCRCLNTTAAMEPILCVNRKRTCKRYMWTRLQNANVWGEGYFTRLM